jgi:hypothetical protein
VSDFKKANRIKGRVKSFPVGLYFTGNVDFTKFKVGQEIQSRRDLESSYAIGTLHKASRIDRIGVEGYPPLQAEKTERKFLMPSWYYYSIHVHSSGDCLSEPDMGLFTGCFNWIRAEKEVDYHGHGLSACRETCILGNGLNYDVSIRRKNR